MAKEKKEEEKIEGQLVPLDTINDLSKVHKKGDIAFSMKCAIMDGHVKPAEAAVSVKRMLEACTLVLKDKEVAAVMKADIEKHIVNGTATILDAEVKIMATYTTYDFAVCGHSRYDALVKIVEDAEAEMKLIEEELKLQLKTYEAMSSKPGKLTIVSSTKDYTIETLPEVVEVSCGEMIPVRIPQKIQNIGMKFFKI